MAKQIIKEIIIFILLLITIALLLGVVFYDYIPNTKELPSKIVSYKLPENIEKELESDSLEGKNIIKTYSIDGTDLGLYESTDQYDKGKINPFEKYEPAKEQTPEENGTSTNTNGNTANNTSTTGNTTNTNNVGSFFNETGK